MSETKPILTQRFDNRVFNDIRFGKLWMSVPRPKDGDVAELRISYPNGERFVILNESQCRELASVIQDIVVTDQEHRLRYTWGDNDTPDLALIVGRPMRAGDTGRPECVQITITKKGESSVAVVLHRDAALDVCAALITRALAVQYGSIATMTEEEKKRREHHLKVRIQNKIKHRQLKKLAASGTPQASLSAA